ncbi:hypothetical protein C8J56DRAFT_1065993 [Mycena floridula]|nr:hypothetical protein C8J56DRAFT_1065993 [Mycena floridula]
MKLESNPPVSANAADIGDFLPPKFIAIGTILVVVVVTFLGQYSSLTVSLGALGLLKSDIESAARDTLAASVLVPDIIIDVNQSRDEFNLLVSECLFRYYRLSATSWHAYPIALARLRWSIRAAKKDGRALLNKIRAHGERENKRRLLGDIKQRAGSR